MGEVDQVATLEASPTLHHGRVGAQGGDVIRQAVGGVCLERFGAGVFEVREHRIIVEQHTVDGTGAGQVFVDFANDLAHLRVKRRQALVLVWIDRHLAGLRVPTGDAGQLRIEGETEHRHPGEDIDVSPGA